MGINFKKFQRMSTADKARYRKNVIRLSRSMLLVHGVGMLAVGIAGMLIVLSMVL